MQLQKERQLRIQDSTVSKLVKSRGVLGNNQYYQQDTMRQSEIEHNEDESPHITHKDLDQTDVLSGVGQLGGTMLRQNREMIQSQMSEEMPNSSIDKDGQQKIEFDGPISASLNIHPQSRDTRNHSISNTPKLGPGQGSMHKNADYQDPAALFPKDSISSNSQPRNSLLQASQGGNDKSRYTSMEISPRKATVSARKAVLMQEDTHRLETNYLHPINESLERRASKVVDSKVGLNSSIESVALSKYNQDLQHTYAGLNERPYQEVIHQLNGQKPMLGEHARDQRRDQLAGYPSGIQIRVQKTDSNLQLELHDKKKGSQPTLKTMDLNPQQNWPGTTASVNTSMIEAGKRPTTSEQQRSLVLDAHGNRANIAQQFNVQIHEMNKTQKKLHTLHNQQQKLSDSIQKKRLQKQGDHDDSKQFFLPKVNITPSYEEYDPGNSFKILQKPVTHPFQRAMNRVDLMSVGNNGQGYVSRSSQMHTKKNSTHQIHSSLEPQSNQGDEQQNNEELYKALNNYTQSSIGSNKQEWEGNLDLTYLSSYFFNVRNQGKTRTKNNSSTDIKSMLQNGSGQRYPGRDWNQNNESAQDIKEQKRTALFENKNLKHQYEDIQQVLRLTSNENQRLKSKIKVLSLQQSRAKIPVRSTNQKGQETSYDNRDPDYVNYGQSMDARKFQPEVSFDTGHTVTTEPPLNKYTEESALKSKDLRRYDLIITQDDINFNAPPQAIHSNVLTFNPMMSRQSADEPNIVRRKTKPNSRVLSDRAPQSVVSNQTQNKDSTADFPPPDTEAEVIDLRAPEMSQGWNQEQSYQSRRGQSQDISAMAMQMNLSNAFQATDVVKKELNQNMQFLLELKQKAAQQEEFNRRLKWENSNLKDKVVQYQRIIEEPTTNENTEEDADDDDGTSKSPWHKSQKGDALSNVSGEGTCTIHPQLHKFEFESKKKDEERQYQICIDMQQFEDITESLRVLQLDKYADRVPDEFLEARNDCQHKKLTELERLKLQNEKFQKLLNKKNSFIEVMSRSFQADMKKQNIVREIFSKATLPGETQDVIAEAISSMIEKSQNLRQMFSNLEVSIMKILGDDCLDVHFIITDGSFTKQIRSYDKNETHFYMKEIHLGDHAATHIQLKKKPIHPTRKKLVGRNKNEYAKEMEKYHEHFLAFSPDYPSFEFMAQNAVIKHDAIIFPVYQDKDDAPRCMMLLQIDMPRDKLNLNSTLRDTANSLGVGDCDITNHRSSLSPQKSLSRKLTRGQTLSKLTIGAQKTTISGKNVFTKYMKQLGLITDVPNFTIVSREQYNDDLLRSFDFIKQLRLVVNCFQGSHQQIIQEKRAIYNGQRVNQILKTMKIFMKSKRHQDLYIDLQTHLPTLFGYEAAGVMFYDRNSGFLYSIKCKDYANTLLSDENIMRFPVNMGLTALAVKTKESVVVSKGMKDPRFSYDVDNIVQITEIQNLVIVPLVDSDGNLMGVIQMVNKQETNIIPKEDVVEMTQIAPSIAEVINFCELAKDVTNVSAGLTFSMLDTMETVEATQKHFKFLHMPQILYHLDQINKSVVSIVRDKQDGTFCEGSMLQKIFGNLQKEQDKITKKKRGRDNQIFVDQLKAVLGTSCKKQS